RAHDCGAQREEVYSGVHHREHGGAQAGRVQLYPAVQGTLDESSHRSGGQAGGSARWSGSSGSGGRSSGSGSARGAGSEGVGETDGISSSSTLHARLAAEGEAGAESDQGAESRRGAEYGGVHEEEGGGD